MGLALSILAFIIGAQNDTKILLKDVLFPIAISSAIMLVKFIKKKEGVAMQLQMQTIMLLQGIVGLVLIFKDGIPAY